MKRNKSTIYDVFKYMNDEQYSFLKYTETTLIQSFTHLNTDFEVRSTKDGRIFFVCIDGIVFAQTASIYRLKKKIAANKQWYLSLNWDGAAEQLSGEMDEKRRVLNEQ